MHRNTSYALQPFRFFHGLWFGLAALALIVMLTACGGGGGSGTTPTAATGTTPTSQPSGNTMAVSITVDSSGTFTFSPTTITIKAGTTVVWTNTTGTSHTVTSDDGKTFDSGIASPIAASGGTFMFTFNTPGTFAYHCQIHPFMKATVVVTQ
jgi:plastocyanin